MSANPARPTTNPNTAPAILRINLAALAANYRLLKSRTEATVAGVIKADAYGLGVEPVFKTLLKEGCGMFFVATPDEAMKLRAHDARAEIMVLGGLYEGSEDFYASRGLTPVLNSLEECKRWADTAGRFAQKLPAVLHFDTGMNRLGLHPLDRPETRAFEVRMIMSHFSSSEDKGSAMNEKQVKAFDMIAQAYPGTFKSLCNSSGLFRHEDWHYDLVRPGYALYGGNPTPETKNPMQPVASLHVRVLQVRDVHRGESAGYNSTYTFPMDTRLATVALGYADGFPRGASNSGKLYWKGMPCPIRGRVSMDLTIVETGHLQDPPQPGDWMELLGVHQDVDALAKDSGTIGYNILTALGPRYRRLYET
jgi:alanine racemase